MKWKQNGNIGRLTDQLGREIEFVSRRFVTPPGLHASERARPRMGLAVIMDWKRQSDWHGYPTFERVTNGRRLERMEL